MVEDVDDLAEELEGHEYILIGESHPDPEIIEVVLEPLITQGELDQIYMEALLEGDQTDNSVPETETEKVYSYNPEKYDKIIQIAEQNDLSIYGLENHGPERRDNEFRKWAEHIHQTAGEQNIVLVGHGHLNHWEDYPKERHLPVHLTEIEEDADIVTVAEPSREYNRENGVYRSDELEDDAGDYIFLTSNNNVPKNSRLTTSLKLKGEDYELEGES